MKTIEERTKGYAPDPRDPDYILYSEAGYVVNRYRDAYIAGTTEQKAIDEEVRLKNCDDMTQAEYDRESAFADWYHKNGKGTPTFSDAIEWARKEVIDRACEWLEEHLYEEMFDLPFNNWIELFKKAMEE